MKSSYLATKKYEKLMYKVSDKKVIMSWKCLYDTDKTENIN